jgi:hypothetical protein
MKWKKKKSTIPIALLWELKILQRHHFKFVVFKVTPYKSLLTWKYSVGEFGWSVAQFLSFAEMKNIARLCSLIVCVFNVIIYDGKKSFAHVLVLRLLRTWARNCVKTCVRACVRVRWWRRGRKCQTDKANTHTHIHITFTPQSPLQSLQISTKFSHNHPRIQIICIQFFCLLFSRTKRNKKMEVVIRQNSFARSLSLT